MKDHMDCDNKAILQVHFDALAKILKEEGEIYGVYRKAMKTEVHYKYEGSMYEVKYYNNKVEGVCFLW